MSNPRESMIKIAGFDIPVHEAWKKIEVLNAGNDLLERLNSKYPDCSTPHTRDIIQVVRDRLKAALNHVGKPPEVSQEIAAFLLEKLQHNGPEDAISLLQSEKNINITMTDLIYIIGPDAYRDAMQREAILYHENKILPEQTAELWNDLERPAPGKAHWTKKDVEKLLDQAPSD